MKKKLVVLAIATTLALGAIACGSTEPTSTQQSTSSVERSESEPAAESTEAITSESTAEPTEASTSEPTAEPTEAPTPEPTATPIPLLEGVSMKETQRLEFKEFYVSEGGGGYLDLFADGFLNQDIPLIKALYNVPDRALSSEEMELLSDDAWSLYNNNSRLLSKEEITQTMGVAICQMELSKLEADGMQSNWDDPAFLKKYYSYMCLVGVSFEKERIARDVNYLIESGVDYIREEDVLALYQEVVDSMDDYWNQYVNICNTMSYNQIKAEYSACSCLGGTLDQSMCSDAENGLYHSLLKKIIYIADSYTEEGLYVSLEGWAEFTDEAEQILAQYR